MKRAVKIAIFLAAAAAIVLSACAVYFYSVTAGVKLQPGKLALSQTCVHVYDGEGREIEFTTGKEKVSLSDLPAYTANAFVAVEDKNFYRHGGFDYKRMGKALLKNIASFSFKEGASTISQQLIKNTHLSGEKTINRKLKEFRLTRALEQRYTKQEILELYVNSIYFGHNAFGICNASRFYFGKSATELTPAESAMLAALVKSPNRYSPFKNAEKCLSRRNFVLELMYRQNYIDSRQYGEALDQDLPESPAETGRNSYLDLVAEELTELFPDAETNEMNDLHVYTFLDGSLQKELEKSQADSGLCALVRDNRTNGIKALYTTAGLPERLPASTIKPLLVYAPALEENLISPATPVLDEAVDFSGYSPSNYGGGYGGYMSVRYALSRSVNIPAVKILNCVGCEKAVSYLEKMNLHVDGGDYSLALALGGMKRGFTLPALADAYATFANGGTFTPSRTVSRVENGKGKVLFRFEQKSRPVFSEDVCSLMNDMLTTAVKEGTAKKLRTLPFPVCAKTGTGANAGANTDAYTISYTKDDTVAVWLGNADNAPIQATGGGKPADIALKIYSFLYRNGAPQSFPDCKEIQKILLDKEEYEKNHRILRADPSAPQYLTVSELFRKSALPEGVSSRFSAPSIEKPAISIKNSTVCIELCQTEYYDYIVEREHNGKKVTVYSGKYRKKIYDNSVLAGEKYTYTVIPVYRGTQGTPVVLPTVCIGKTQETPDNWWE